MMHNTRRPSGHRHVKFEGIAPLISEAEVRRTFESCGVGFVAMHLAGAAGFNAVGMAEGASEAQLRSAVQKLRKSTEAQARSLGVQIAGCHRISYKRLHWEEATKQQNSGSVLLVIVPLGPDVPQFPDRRTSDLQRYVQRFAKDVKVLPMQDGSRKRERAHSSSPYFANLRSMMLLTPSHAAADALLSPQRVFDFHVDREVLGDYSLFALQKHVKQRPASPPKELILSKLPFTLRIRDLLGYLHGRAGLQENALSKANVRMTDEGVVLYIDLTQQPHKGRGCIPLEAVQETLREELQDVGCAAVEVKRHHKSSKHVADDRDSCWVRLGFVVHSGTPIEGGPAIEGDRNAAIQTETHITRTLFHAGLTVRHVHHERSMRLTNDVYLLLDSPEAAHHVTSSPLFDATPYLLGGGQSVRVFCLAQTAPPSAPDTASDASGSSNEVTPQRAPKRLPSIVLQNAALSALELAEELIAAGVDSIETEGKMVSVQYLCEVVLQSSNLMEERAEATALLLKRAHSFSSMNLQTILKTALQAVQLDPHCVVAYETLSGVLRKRSGLIPRYVSFSGSTKRWTEEDLCERRDEVLLTMLHSETPAQLLCAVPYLPREETLLLPGQEEVCQKVLSLSTSNIERYKAMLFLSRLSKGWTAEAHLRNAIRLCPERPAAYILLAKVLSEDGSEIDGEEDDAEESNAAALTLKAQGLVGLHAGVVERGEVLAQEVVAPVEVKAVKKAVTFAREGVTVCW